MLRSRVSFYLMAFFSVVIALSSYRFLFLGLPLSFQGMEGHIDNRLFSFMIHISLAPIALLLGVIQFSPKIRAKMPAVHRWSGRVYGVCVLLSGAAGFIVALGAKGGVVATVGFVILACVWVFTTVVGIQYARASRFIEHRRWMIRSFALTLAGVTLRLQLVGFMGAGLEYTEASVYVAWLCWVPNMIAAEWWLRRGKTA